MTWKQITLKQFKQLAEITSKEYEDDILKTAEVIKVLFNIEDPMDLSPMEFQKYVKEIEFLNTEIPETKLCNTYTINGTKYNFKGNIFECNMSQLMDVRNFTTKVPYDDAEVLSVFVIPEGHKYNDGYDMDKTIEDINSIPVTDAMRMTSFFVQALQVSTHILIDYLNKEMKSLQTDKEKKEQILQQIELLKQLTDLIYSHSPYVTAK